MEDNTNFITLLDGSRIASYPKETKESLASGDLYIELYGKSMSLKRQNMTDREYKKLRESAHRSFYEHIHLFLGNAGRILSDSRMFLAPVPVQNGLAYFGPGGFRNPTLGIYVEWWLNHKDSAFDKEGNPIWYISGSPLSGAHACCSVNCKGKSLNANLQGRFKEVWSSFMAINKRYTDAKSLYSAYSLEEVIGIIEKLNY